MTRQLVAELVDGAGAVLGEGPLWNADTAELSWVDILGGRVHVADADGRPTASYEVGGHVGAALPAEGGGWLLATRDGFSRLQRDGAVRELLSVEADRPEQRFNDAKCDPWGQALAGTMRYDETPGSATLYRLESAGSEQDGREQDGHPALAVRVLLDRLGLANGLGWDPDGHTLYFVDSLDRSVARHHYHPDEGLGTRGLVLSFDASLGIPDGMCVDERGYLWVAFHGGGVVQCLRPDGHLEAVVTLPAPLVTSVAFGGANGDRLFITTAGGDGSPDPGGIGGLWALDPGVAGPPATPWRPVPPVAEAGDDSEYRRAARDGAGS